MDRRDNSRSLDRNEQYRDSRSRSLHRRRSTSPRERNLKRKQRRRSRQNSASSREGRRLKRRRRSSSSHDRNAELESNRRSPAHHRGAGGVQVEERAARNNARQRERQRDRRRKKIRKRQRRQRQGDEIAERRSSSSRSEISQLQQQQHRTAGVVSDDDEHLRSPSRHDDSIGHFQGGPGTVVAHRYRVVKQVGLGTFGRVVECLDLRARQQHESRYRPPADQYVALKIVRSVQRYCESALIEARIIQDVNRRGGRGRTHCVILHDAFTFGGHYCMVFESLGPSLYDFLKAHKYRPFPMECVHAFTVQLLEMLEFLHSFGLIHTDLKIENLCLMSSRERLLGKQKVPASNQIKLIDFGGACYDDDRHKSTVINTRQYRAPEVIFGLTWSMPSDMWSAACVMAELYRGELLFATHDDLEHLALMERIVGPFPVHILQQAERTSQLAQNGFDSRGKHRVGRALPAESAKFVKKQSSLESIIDDPGHHWFLRLLRKLLVLDADERATAHESIRYLQRINKDRYIW